MDENSTPSTFDYSDTEDDAILPVGYKDGDDFFDPSTWTGETEAAESAAVDAESPDTETVPETGDTQEAAPAIEQTESADTEGAGEQPPEEAPAIEPTPEQPELPQSNIRKVHYQFNHEDMERDVDLDKDLPELLQKSQSVDKYKERLTTAKNQIDRFDRVAKALGHDTSDDFLTAIIDTARKTERDELLAAGTAETIVDDYLDRKYGPAMAQDAPESAEALETGKDTAEVSEASSAAPAASTASNPSGRDYTQESMDLMKAYPEMVGKQLPQEVVRDAVLGKKTLTEAYRAYKEQQQSTEADKLRKENKILKQNAAAASRAPVTGVTKGGSTEQKAEDPFLKGFNDEW